MEYKRRFSQTQKAQERVSFRKMKTSTTAAFLEDVLNERKDGTMVNEEVKKTSKCSISLVSNYILIIIFTALTGVFFYFAYVFPGE
jgi:hypothetical protein